MTTTRKTLTEIPADALMIRDFASRGERLHDACRRALDAGHTLGKYEDPSGDETSDAAIGLDLEEATDLCGIDPGLVFVVRSKAAPLTSAAESLDDLVEDLDHDAYQASNGDYTKLPTWGDRTEEVERRIAVSGPEKDLVSWDTRSTPHRYLVRVFDGGTNRFSVEEEGENYHLTETGSGAWSVGTTMAGVGGYPATETEAASYVAPGEYVREWMDRRRYDFTPGTDDAIRSAVEAHRRGEELPPVPPPTTPTWGTPDHPEYYRDPAIPASGIVLEPEPAGPAPKRRRRSREEDAETIRRAVSKVMPGIAAVLRRDLAADANHDPAPVQPARVDVVAPATAELVETTIALASPDLQDYAVPHKDAAPAVGTVVPSATVGTVTVTPGKVGETAGAYLLPGNLMLSSSQISDALLVPLFSSEATPAERVRDGYLIFLRGASKGLPMPYAAVKDLAAHLVTTTEPAIGPVEQEQAIEARAALLVAMASAVFKAMVSAAPAVFKAMVHVPAGEPASHGIVVAAAPVKAPATSSTPPAMVVDSTTTREEVYAFTGSLGITAEVMASWGRAQGTQVVRIDKLGSGEARPGDVNSRCTFFHLTCLNGYSSGVASTNGDPVWEEQNATAFVKLAEACGVEL